MGTKKLTPKIVVIVGETASGKSELAMQVALKFNGEIICADSKTIYRYLDIGTAKPSKSDRRAVKHYLVDILDPDQSYNVSMFKFDALKAIDDIIQKNKLPIIVGGTGLYIDSILYDYKFGKNPSDKKRKKLETKSLEELQEMANKQGITKGTIDFKNKRHLIRAIENRRVINERADLRENTLVIGLSLKKDLLEQRIIQRVDNMIDDGFIDEVQKVSNKFGWENEAMTGIGYRAFKDYLDGLITLEEAKAEFIKGDKSLAKKQRTWFKRNKSIQWINNSKEALVFVQQFLNK